MTPSATTTTIRQALRAQTAPLHATLDREMGRFDLARARDYRRFLGVQLAARRPIEAWIAAAGAGPGPAGDAAPPPQVALIGQDLAELGGDPDFAALDFTLPADADPLGLYWVLAGSFMGNRAMLADLRRQGSTDVPTRFLESAAMGEYWRRLRPLLERAAAPATTAAAARAARAGFTHFLDTDARARQEIAS